MCVRSAFDRRGNAGNEGCIDGARNASDPAGGGPRLDATFMSAALIGAEQAIALQQQGDARE